MHAHTNASDRRRGTGLKTVFVSVCGKSPATPIWQNISETTRVNRTRKIIYIYIYIYIRALHSILSNLSFDIRPVYFRAILTERAAFKLE